MELEFKDKQGLALMEQGEAIRVKFPASVVNSFRSKINLLRAAPDGKTLREWKSLRYKKMKGERKGDRSIRLNDQWRLIFFLDEAGVPPKIVVLKIEDYH